MRRLWVAAASLALAACSGAQAAQPSPEGRPAAPAAPTSAVTLAFGGDVHFDGDLARLLDGDDGLAELRPLLGSADVAVVNLETSITDRGAPEPKTYHFRTSPKALSTLAKAGVDVLSMANNHAVDYGPARPAGHRWPPRPRARSRSSASVATPRRRSPLQSCRPRGCP